MEKFKSILKFIRCANGKECMCLYLMVLSFFLFVSTSPVVAQQQRGVRVNGVVLDEKGDPLAGVTVVNTKDRSNGTITNVRGNYALFVNSLKDSLEFSFLGYEKQVIVARDASLIRMEPDDMQLDEVVVTGIYTRKAESFTGASTTMGKEELTRVGNQNMLESLKNIDPTIYMPDNLSMGSDPNSTPTMSMRGNSSFPADEAASSFKSNYQNQPNQPLFILDGFETSVQTVMDMDMNRVESMTILKDASAGALGCYCADHTQLQNLMRQLGQLMDMKYYPLDSEENTNPYAEASPENVLVALDSLGYSHSALHSYTWSSVFSQLRDGLPVYCRADSYTNNAGNTIGHAWVIDGAQFQSKLWQTWEESDTDIDTLIDEVDLSIRYLHINWGYDGNNNGMFQEGVFITDEYEELDEGCADVRSEYFNSNVQIITNIIPSTNQE